MAEHQRFLLGLHLERLTALERDVTRLDERITEHLAPFRAQHQLLMQIPGLDWVSAAAILAETGVDMSVFGSASRLAAWAGVAPGHYESAGRATGSGTRKGNLVLKSTLFAAASAAVKTKGSYYKDKYHRLRARRGPVRALLAIAHKLLIAVYHLLSSGEDFQELGETFLDRQARKRSTTKLVGRLNSLGYEVVLIPKAA
jgi:transposase